MKKRLQYFDTIKLFAILWIFWTHFINRYRRSLFSLWKIAPYSWILRGLTGKLCVAVFAVISGYLAYSRGKGPLLKQTVKRYLNFLVMGLFVNIIYSLYAGNSLTELKTIGSILLSSVRIDSRIFATFWCMQSFFCGTVISYFNRKYNVPFFVVVATIFVLIAAGYTWTAIFLMGNLLYMLTENGGVFPKVYQLLCNHAVQIVFCVVVFFAIKRSESNLTYIIDGICTAMVLSIIIVNQRVQKFFSNTFFSTLGRYSTGIYLLHPVVYNTIGRPFFDQGEVSIIGFLGVFCLCVCVTIVLSIGFVRLINQCTQWIYNIFLKMCSSLKIA